MVLLKIVVFSLLVVSVWSVHSLTVLTKSGPVKGILVSSSLNKQVKAFLGIPYAKPPIGPLRFNSPQPVDPWTETFLASKKSKSCLQGLSSEIPANASRPWWVPDDKDTSEDCLTLNVWVPVNLTRKTAVIVYVHGGGFEGGTSASDRLDGRNIVAEGDVIFVSMNYRTNIFGFLYLPDYPDQASGNMGMMDQALALKWVKDNAKAFGGDPDLVTLMGISAGGAAVNLHLSIPSSAGLFHRLIVQSGTSNNYWSYVDRVSATNISSSVVLATGCKNTRKKPTDVLKCLRNLETFKLLNISKEVSRKSPLTIKWAPYLDHNNKYLTVVPEKAFEKGMVDSKIEVLLGSTSEEASFYPIVQGIIGPYNDSFIDQDTLRKAIKMYLKTNQDVRRQSNTRDYEDDVIAEMVHFIYTNWEDPNNGEYIRENLVRFTTDLIFHCKTNAMSDLLSNNGNQVFRYLFTHRPSDTLLPFWAGSIHGDDVNFVHGWALNISGTVFTPSEQQLARNVIQLLANFAKYGNPNGVTACPYGSWPTYSTDEKKFLNLGTKIELGYAYYLRLQECAFWNTLYPKIKKSIVSK